MSPKQLRGKDAKAEGRGPPEEIVGTMETFKALTKRLLTVAPAEVAERQRLYNKGRATRHEKEVPQNEIAPIPRKLKRKKLLNSLVFSTAQDTKNRQKGGN